MPADVAALLAGNVAPERRFLAQVISGELDVDMMQVEMVQANVEPYDLKVNNGPGVRFMYLTAWATEDGRVNFRDDIYGLDGTGFILGQPEPKTF